MRLVKNIARQMAQMGTSDEATDRPVVGRPHIETGVAPPASTSAAEPAQPPAPTGPFPVPPVAIIEAE